MDRCDRYLKYGRLFSGQVGNQRYEELLNDIGTSNYYRWMIPWSDEPLPNKPHGHPMWRNEADPDPWEPLIHAMIGVAAKDYATALIDGPQWLVEELRGWFLENEFATPVMREVERMVRSCRSRWELNHLPGRIRTNL